MTRPAARPARGRAGAPAGRFAAAALAAVLLAAAATSVACAGEDDGRAAPTSHTTSAGPTTPTSEAVARWAIDDTGGAIEIDAGSYRLTIADDGRVTYQPVGAGDADARAGRIFVVRDGQRHDVTSIDRAKLGLDHVTLDASFDDGTTARVELGADRGDVVAVRIAPDDPSGVTDRGLDLPPELVSSR